MKTLDVSPALRLPALEAQTGTMIVYGGKGMGKTNFESVLAEEFAKLGLKFSILDPYGVAWGLKYAVDGKGPGIEIVKIGGQKPDLKLVPTTRAAESAADFVVDEDVSTLIDISRHPDGKMWSNGERIRFVRDYCNHLFMRQGERRRPVMQIIDECGKFAPQQFPRGADHIAECLGAVEQLCEIGRNVGIGACLITQRSARMAKSVSELADAMIAFRTVGPNSIDAIIDWFGEHVPKPRQKELIERVRQLPVGTALVVSPGWLEIEGEFPMRARQTFDSSKTPVAGKESRVTGRGAVVDVEKYKTRMAEIEEQADANNPKALQKELARLRKELAAASKQQPSESEAARPAQVKELERQVARLGKALEVAMKFIVQINVQDFPIELDDADKETLEKAIAAAVESGTKLLDRKLDARQKQFDRLKRDGQRLLKELQGLASSDVAVQVDVRKQEPYVATPRAERPAQPRPESNGQLSNSQQAILDAVAWLREIGQDPARRTAVGLVSGFSSTSGGFNNNLGRLRGEGLIDYPSGGFVALTDTGVELARAPDVAGEHELRELVYRRVGASRASLLRFLVDAYPEALSREQLGEATGFSWTSGGFNNNLGALRTLGLIDYPQKGYVAATDALFIGGA